MTTETTAHHESNPPLGLGCTEVLGALPLTDAQIADVIREATGWQAPHSAFFNLVRAIERAHGIGAK